MDELILMRRFREGDKEAFQNIYEQFYRIIYRHADKKIDMLRMMGYALPEDVVSEIFYKLFVNREKLQDLNHIKRWLFMATSNKIIDIKYHHSKITETKEYELYSADEFEVYDGGGRFNKIDMSLICACIRQLPHRQQEVLSGLFFDHLSSHELAEKCQISRQTVLNCKTMALKTLRTLLSKYEESF